MKRILRWSGAKPHALLALSVALLSIPVAAEAFTPYDVNASSAVDAVDVQLVINAALGLSTGFNCDTNGDLLVNAIDIQLMINAVLGLAAPQVAVDGLETMTVGETAVFTAQSTEPQDSFTWTSSLASVATVNSTGEVSAVGTGTVKISATSTLTGVRGNRDVAVGVITVTGPDVTGVGQTAQFVATSSDAKDDFRWSSSNAAVASVDSEGLVTASATGTANISVTGSRSKRTASQSLTVHAVTVSGPAAVGVGKTVQLTPSSTDVHDQFTWASSDITVASVDAQGVVSGVSVGTVEITATGTHSTATDKHLLAIAAVSVSGPSILGVGGTAVFAAESTNASETFAWASSNESVATVSADGTVRAIGAGYAIVTATGNTSGAEGAAELMVVAVTIEGRDAIGVRQTAQLSATSTDPQDQFAWASSNTSVATVSAGGLVTAVANGSTQITVTGSHSGVSATRPFAVHSVTVSGPATIPKGVTKLFSATSTDAQDTPFAWSSSNTSVAIVNSSGSVTALTEGAATISAAGAHSGATGSRQVTVTTAEACRLLWDGETTFDYQNGVVNYTDQYRGAVCFEGRPTLYHAPRISLAGTEAWRADISGYDEVWFFAKVSAAGKSMQFSVTAWPENSNSISIDPYVVGGPVDTDWKLVRIPVPALKTATYDLSKVESLMFGKATDSTGYKVFVDEVWAVNLSQIDASESPLVGEFRALDFGNVVLGASATLFAQISNIGAADLDVASVAVEGDMFGEFDADNESFTLSPGASTEIAVDYVPLKPGVSQATLVLTHSPTAMGQIAQIKLSGCGVGPKIDVRAASMSFGSIGIGNAATLTLQVANNGNDVLELTGLSTSHGDFAVTSAPADLLPNAVGEIAVTFSPTSELQFAERLSITSDDPFTPEADVLLYGRGIASGSLAAIDVHVDSLSSSTVRLSWPGMSQAAAVRVYVGPEPRESGAATLPLRRLLQELPAEATSYTVQGLAPAVDSFFEVEVTEAGGSIVASGVAYARTAGGPGADLDEPVRSVHLYAPNVLLVVTTDLMVHSYTLAGDRLDGGIDRLVGYTGPQLQAGPWLVRRNDGSTIQVLDVHRQSIPVDQGYYIPRGTDEYGNRLDVDHLLYLVLAEPVGTREILSVQGPALTWEVLDLKRVAETRNWQLEMLVPYSDRYLETPVIQVNQVGYCPGATERYAYVSGWMGDGGPLDLSGFPATADVLVEPENALDERTPVVSSLSIGLRRENDPDAGTNVNEINLAGVPPSEGTVYRVHVPGVGVSWPTQVSESSIFKSLYVTARGLYLNRWGRDLKTQWTDWAPRPPDHGTVFTSDEPGWWLETGAFTEATPRVGQRWLQGGHHDAGDFDIRPQHYLNALYMMRAFELNEGAFYDGQLNIPESGNGIPDLMDEIVWSLAGWEQLQEANGGIRAGAESYSHPPTIAYADEDTLPYWTYGVDTVHTLRVAGLFAQAARLIMPYDAAKSEELGIRAQLAYDYAISAGITKTIGGPLMYAAGELFRFTGEDQYRLVFEEMWRERDKYGYGPAIYVYMPWQDSFRADDQPILLDHVLGYLTGPDADPVILSQAMGVLDMRARDAVSKVADLYAHRNGRPDGGAGWGSATTMGRYVMAIYARLQLGNVPEEDLQDYFNAISLSADYVLGCNPLGMVWISGLGTRFPRGILHHDSLTFAKDTSLPCLPGLPVFGPTANMNAGWYYDFGENVFYPAFGELPLLRRYGDIRSFVNMNEFTVWESQIPHVELFSILVAADQLPPETWQPGQPEHQSTLPGRESCFSD